MSPEPGQAVGAGTLRGALRRGLTAAMKARETDTVAVLRTAIAAIDNAEAVAAPDASPVTTSARIAGARAGVGAAEAARRPLSADEAHAIVADLMAEQTREADRYDEHGQPDAARRLRNQARLLATYLTP